MRSSSISLFFNDSNEEEKGIETKITTRPMFIKKIITRRHICMYESVTYVHIDKDNYIVHTYTNKTTREKPFLNSVYNFVNR